MFPSSKQFSKWSLPTKWGFVGSVTGLIGFSFWLFGHFLGLTSSAIGNIPKGKTQLEIANDDLEAIVKSEEEKLEKLRLDTEKLTKEARQSTDLALKRIKQFDYLNGQDPYDNYEIFLQKYYGLADYAPMGDLLIEDMAGREVEWAVTVENINYQPKATMLIFTVNNPVCSKGDCPENFTPISWVEFTDTDGNFPLPNQIKIGDHMHIRGKLILYPDDDSGNNVGPRFTAHIHPVKIQYKKEE